MKKRPTKNGETSVTFELSATLNASTVFLCGDFNDWSQDAQPMKRRTDGSFSTTLRLPKGRYEFRYLVDDELWVNDWDADQYERNAFGEDNSVLVL